MRIQHFKMLDVWELSETVVKFCVPCFQILIFVGNTSSSCIK